MPSCTAITNWPPTRSLLASPSHHHSNRSSLNQEPRRCEERLEQFDSFHKFLKNETWKFMKEISLFDQEKSSINNEDNNINNWKIKHVLKMISRNRWICHISLIDNCYFCIEIYWSSKKIVYISYIAIVLYIPLLLNGQAKSSINHEKIMFLAFIGFFLKFWA